MMPDIPEVAGVERMVILPGEVLVVKSNQALSTRAIENIHQQFSSVFPGVRVIVLDQQISLLTMRVEDAT